MWMGCRRLVVPVAFFSLHSWALHILHRNNHPKCGVNKSTTEEYEDIIIPDLGCLNYHQITIFSHYSWIESMNFTRCQPCFWGPSHLEVSYGATSHPNSREIPLSSTLHFWRPPWLGTPSPKSSQGAGDRWGPWSPAPAPWAARWPPSGDRRPPRPAGGCSSHKRW